MLNLYLKINNIPIDPMLALSSSEANYIFKNLSFIKANFLMRRIIGAFPGEKVYFCKNCKLSLLNCFELPANLHEYDFKTVIKNYPVSGTWGTSAFLSFYNRRLFKIATQVISNNSIANFFFSLCQDKLISLYGNPVSQSQVRLIWKNTVSHIILSVSGNNSNLLFSKSN